MYKTLVPSLILTLSTTLLIPHQAHAWGDLGHAAIGELAEQSLSPQAKNFVYRLMGPEPMAVSATFPDEVRQDARFKDFANYHFLDLPDEYTFDTLPADKIMPINANTIIDQVPHLLLDPNYTLEQKKIWFRYLIHVVGDIHQPLHVGNTHDLGGNLCEVKIEDPASGKVGAANLHTVWDETLINHLAKRIAIERNLDTKGKRWFTYKDLVAAALASQSVKPSEATESKRPGEWYNESQKLRTTQVYPDRGQIFTATTRNYCKQNDANMKIFNGAFDPSKVPTLDQKYIDDALVLTKKQILKAGYRLAALIEVVSQKAFEEDLEEALGNSKSIPASTFFKELNIQNPKY